MRTYLVLLKRELISITREKTIMFAIILQFMIASLSSIILVGLMAFYDPTTISQNTGTNIRIGLVEGERSPLSVYLKEKGIKTVFFDDLTEAEEAFRKHRIDAVLEIPATEGQTVNMKLFLPEMDTSRTVIMMLLQEPLKEYENYLRRSNGVIIRYDNIGGKPGNTYEFLYCIIIPVLMLFPSLIAGSIMIDTVTEEFENRTFDTLTVAPVTTGTIFLAKISAAVITAFLQVVLWTFLLELNGLTVNNPMTVILISVVIAALISLFAAFIGMLFKDRERAQFIYSIVLVFAVSMGYITGFSPVSLITQVAADIPHYPSWHIIIYLFTTGLLGTGFSLASRKLALQKI